MRTVPPAQTSHCPQLSLPLITRRCPCCLLVKPPFSLMVILTFTSICLCHLPPPSLLLVPSLILICTHTSLGKSEQMSEDFLPLELLPTPLSLPLALGRPETSPSLTHPSLYTISQACHFFGHWLSPMCRPLCEYALSGSVLLESWDEAGW